MVRWRQDSGHHGSLRAPCHLGLPYEFAGWEEVIEDFYFDGKPTEFVIIGDRLLLAYNHTGGRRYTWYFLDTWEETS